MLTPWPLLDFDPSYPRNPVSWDNIISKWRMDKGVSQVDLARAIGVNEMTIVNWETRSIAPAKRHMENLKGFVREVPQGWNLDSV